MHSFIISCLFATVLAAPQGYNYNQQRYDVPVGSNNFNTNSQLTPSSKTQESQGFLQQTFSSGKLPQLLSGGQITAHNTQDFSTAPNFSKFQPGTQQNFGFNGVQQQQNVPLITNFEGQQQQQQFNTFQQQQQQQQLPGQSTITKDIYVHVPPEDVQNTQFQQPALPPPPPRKHYRIVFIKAPSHNINNNALRIQQAPTEEKTIIYVLTKKTDPLDIQAALQEAQPKQPSKPEVYFIKYKTQEEAKHAQHTIQAQYEKLGGTSQISDEGIAPVTSVIGALDGAPQQQKQPAFNFSNVSGHASSSLAASTSSSSLTTNGAINNSNKYLPPITKL